MKVKRVDLSIISFIEFFLVFNEIKQKTRYTFVEDMIKKLNIFRLSNIKQTPILFIFFSTIMSSLLSVMTAKSHSIWLDLFHWLFLVYAAMVFAQQ